MDTKLIKRRGYIQMKYAFERFVREVGDLCISPAVDNKWLDNQEVCRLLNIQPRTLQKYRNYRNIPYSVIGGKYYYKSSDVDKIITNLKFKQP